MPESPSIKYGILKTRDLVELYYAAQMVANVIESQLALTATAQQILKPDPRRIKYEIYIASPGPAALAVVELSTGTAFSSATATVVAISPNTTFAIRRDFLTDFETVCLPVQALDLQAQCFITVRETFLTPAPVDQLP